MCIWHELIPEIAIKFVYLDKKHYLCIINHKHMPELLLHYIWQQQLWKGLPQVTTTGLPIEILSVGQHNRDAGPDFNHARLRINGQEWVGNIEMHIHASDWRKHRHHTNPAYDNVILHIVCQDDEQVYNSRGEQVTQCVLQYPQSQDYLTQLLAQAKQMDTPMLTIPCSKQLLLTPEILTHGWRTALLKQRWQCKTESIQHLLQITHNDWAQAFYVTLAHNFGFHTNSLPFESLALHTPLACLLKHRNSLFQITAILLGQSGLLNDSTAINEEKKALWAEYQFLQKKFQLSPIDPILWKRARMRPQNAPEVRVRQFAQLMHQSEWLFSRMLQANSIEELRTLLRLQSIDSPHPLLSMPAQIGQSSVDILLINTLLPYRYAYAKEKTDTNKMLRTLALMEQLPAENNSITRQWKMIGQQMKSAADTQALIHLYQHYCQHDRCIHCEVGQLVFEKAAM